MLPSAFWLWETLRVLWEWKGKSGSPHKAIHTLLVGNREAKVIASEWMRPHLRCDSLDTVPPNGTKVAQCTPLLHQRDLPSLVKLGAWRHSLFVDLLLFFTGKWNVQCFSPWFWSREIVCCLSKDMLLICFCQEKQEWYGKFWDLQIKRKYYKCMQRLLRIRINSQVSTKLYIRVQRSMDQFIQTVCWRYA